MILNVIQILLFTQINLIHTLKQEIEEIKGKESLHNEVKVKTPTDRPTEPTYPWRRPSKTDEVKALNLNCIKTTFLSDEHFR